jgi:hypothetical protein
MHPTEEDRLKNACMGKTFRQTGLNKKEIQTYLRETHGIKAVGTRAQVQQILCKSLVATITPVPTPVISYLTPIPIPHTFPVTTLEIYDETTVSTAVDNQSFVERRLDGSLRKEVIWVVRNATSDSYYDRLREVRKALSQYEIQWFKTDQTILGITLPGRIISLLVHGNLGSDYMEPEASRVRNRLFLPEKGFDTDQLDLIGDVKVYKFPSPMDDRLYIVLNKTGLEYFHRLETAQMSPEWVPIPKIYFPAILLE